MKLVFTVVVLLALCTSGCVRRAGRNSDCKWPGEPGATLLDPKQPATARHLSADTEFAEELADRYTNVHFGPHSGYSGPPVAGIERHRCMQRMFDEIGKMHGVTTDTVIASYGRNRMGIDLAEILSFAFIYGAAAFLVSRRLWRRYPPIDGWAAALVMMALCSLAFGVGAVLVGTVWSTTAESIRIGTGHLGSRALQLPTQRYPGLVFAAAIVLFWTVAVAFRPAAAHEQDAAGA